MEERKPAAGFTLQNALPNDRSVSEIGRQAVWHVTSAKPGNGVDLLRDGKEDTYWQSDGAQPHLINVQFQRKARIKTVAIYADYRVDESYTPQRISVRAGSSFHDLKEIRSIEVTEPKGWIIVHMRPPNPLDKKNYLKAFFLQIAIITNHQNGRDTHIRQIKVFGPRHDVTQAQAMSTVSQGPSVSRQSVRGFGCSCKSLRPPSRRAALRRPQVVRAAANAPKSEKSLQRGVEQFFEKYDVGSAGLGALTVTSYCVWRGQDPLTALSITVAATVAALVINEYIFENKQ